MGPVRLPAWEGRIDAVPWRVAPRERLAAVVAGLIEYFDDNPHLLDLIQHAEALQKPGGEFPWQKTRSLTMSLVQEVLEAGCRQGLFAIDDPGLATLMLLGGLRAVVRFGDRPVLEGILDRAKGSGYGIRTLIREIVMSELFRRK